MPVFSIALVLLLHLLSAATISTARRVPLPRCDIPYRIPDGICTTRGRGLESLRGSAPRVYRPLFEARSSLHPAGQGLPSARAISNALFTQTRSIFDRRGLNEFAGYFAQFLLHDISQTPINRDETFDIHVPPGDRAGDFTTAIPFFRSLRDKLSSRDRQEFPVNAQTSAVDLSVLYGASKERQNFLRTGTGGTLDLDDGDRLQKATFRLLDTLPRIDDDFFVSGDIRVNENPVLTSLHTVFAREHNRIAAELSEIFPDDGDELLFSKARLINGAQFQKIVYEEWFPAMTGENVPRYRGFMNSVDPTVSVLFSTVAFQVHHSMLGNRINRYGPGNARMAPLPMKDSLYPKSTFLERNGVEPYLRGALQTNSQAVDAKVTDLRRDMLYTNIANLYNEVDIAAGTIQRGRDHNVPSYSRVRQLFGLSKVTSFQDLKIEPRDRATLRELYERVEDVEAFVGLLAERPVQGSSVGETILEIWRSEFRRLRDGDRFFFRDVDAFPTEIRDTPTVNLLLSNEDTLRRILVANSGVTDRELPRSMFSVR